MSDSRIRSLESGTGAEAGTVLLELENVGKHFEQRPDWVERLLQSLGMMAPQSVVRAVEDVSFQLHAGEFVGLVGESGCGKSTLARIIAGLLEASSGSIGLDGERLNDLSLAERRRRQLAVQMIFQDPFASLNPRLRVREIIGEAPRVHGLCRPGQVDGYVSGMLTRVGLGADVMDRFPHQFSGGQRQRIGIARALAMQPRVMVCDESVAALDVSIQAQVLNLFMELRHATGGAWLFISHDLGVVEHVCDRVLIMYLGRIVESGDTEFLYQDPRHPYTQALLDDLPRLDQRRREFRPLSGEIPSPLNPPSGCHFHPRCPLAGPRCSRERPQLKALGKQRLLACHLEDGGVE
ncbi:MAG: ATP-binding cassette domain-containing protein [Wenzhouxiangella sp.]|nr:ATP-binding cassette domain-containing protein [Wenzhouxiangella sp.]